VELGALSPEEKGGNSAARFGALLWIAVSVAIGATGASMWILYREALSVQIERMGEIAYGQARLVEAVADFDTVQSQDAHPEGALMATVQQVANGHHRWLSREPELELAVIQRRPSGYVTLARHGALVPKPQRVKPIPFAPIAIRRVLAGESGALRTQTSDGRDVIAGYAWITNRELAILAQIPTARTQAPFVQAAMISGVSALLIIGLGALAFRKTGLPLLEELKRELRVRREAEARLAEHQQHLEQLVLARTDALQRAQDELVRTERLATLGKLTATVSHELRNPLGTLRNSLYSIKERLRDETFGLEHVIARAQRSAARCDAIIDELLALTRNRQPQPQLVELSPWLQELIGEFELPGGFRVSCKFTEDSSVYVDPEDLRRCVLNLLSNAAHAAASAEHSPATGKILITTQPAQEMIALHVEDNGTGMSSEVTAHLFEPLFSTKSFGVGLGLCIVRDLINKNHGSIQFANLPGAGTRATLLLPRSARSQAREERAS
jgi:signal transduction histidine kinase